MSRVQLALNVADLEKSVEFYATLFGTQPHKRRPGYANFAITEPPLKLVLIEVPADQRGEGTAQALNHLGIEVASSADVEAGAARLRDAGLAAFDERDTTASLPIVAGMNDGGCCTTPLVGEGSADRADAPAAAQQETCCA